MKLPLPQQRRNAIAFVAILLVATLAPIGFSSQIERLVQGIVRPPGPVPDGGDVGEGIAKVLTNLDPVLARVERIVAYLEDLGRVGNPNPTSPYFLDFQFDRGEQARRLGGWGDWAGSKGWVADPRAPRAPGSLHGVTFGSNQTASYPIGPQAQSSFLVSPRISLRSLPMPQLATPGTPAGSALPATVGGGDAEGQPDSLRLTGEGAAQDGYTRAGAAATGVAGQAPEGSLVVPAIQQGLDSGQGVVTAEQGVGLTTGVADPHRILLTLTHRYNFGFVYRPVAGQVGGGLDGGRVEAFTHAPTADDLRGGGQVLTPLAASYQPTAAFAGGGAFTGSSLNLTQDQFDLTALAGQDVWLVFHAATNPWARSATAYFANGNYFNTMLPGRGWTLNQVQVEGPAFLDNVRIDQVLKPDFPDGAADRYKAAEGANDFAMLLLNRGLRDEAVLPSLDLTREGGEKATCTLPPLSPPLRPGEVRRVTFPASACPAEDLAHGTNYTVAFHAAVPGADGFPSDNDVGGLNVRTLPSPDVVPDGLPLLTPALGDGNTHRRVTMPLRNPGFGDASVLATILVQRVDPEGRVVAEVTQSAVQGRSGQPVPGPGGDDPHAMTLVIPGDAADVANHLSAAWDLLLPQGRYNVTVEARMAASGHSIQDAFLLHASTLVAEPDPYSIDFADPFATPIDAALANRTAAPWNQWTTRSWIDTPPPQCETPSQDPGPWSPCPGKIWEVTGQADAPQSTAAVTYVLSGTFASVPAQTRFTSLQVDVQHQMQDLNCGPVGAGASCNANTVPGPAAIGLTQLSPAAPTSAGQPSDQAAQALGNVQKVNWAIGPHIGSTRADINGNTATVNRFMELDGQWMRESRTFTQGFTGAQLQEMALQFQLDMVGSGGSTGSCPQPGFQSYCPTWRVSYVNVVGTTDAGERIVLLRLNGAPAPGDDGSDVGGWATFVQIDRANFKAQTGPTSAQPFQDCLTRLDPAHPEQATTCRGWQGRDLALHPLVPPASPWAHGDLLALGTAQGVWSTADPAQPRMDYAPRQRGLLVSPALLVPADALDPHLFISHLFQFGSSSIADVTNTDGGTLMVRFLDDPADLHPVSPFMPVAVQYNATAGRPLDPFKPQRYTGTDCDFYYNQQFIARQRQDPALEKEPTPATKAKCNTFDLGKRGPSVEDLQLSRLSYLDYSRQRVDPDTSVVNDADPAALVQDADLRGRIVQFAFRADATPDHPSDKHRCDAVCPSQGWVIDGVSLRKNLQSAFDVKVIDAQIAADYDWVGLGVGPGTHVKLHLDVANVGLFPVNNTGTVTVRLKDLDGGKEEPPLVLPLPSSFSLQPGDVGPLEVPLDIPALSTSDAGSRMAILASVRLGGFPEAQRDNNGGDNCALFRQPDAAAPLNDWSPVCDLTAGPAVLLRAVHDLRARYTVTPLVDRVDGPRTQNVTIENVGNVVVEDAVLTLLQQQICPSGGATCPGAEEESWRIATSPPPGATWGMDSPAFAFTPGAGTTHPAPPAVLALGATGRFLLVAQVASAPGKSDHRFGNLVSLVAESLDNLYSDDFGGSQAAAPTPSCTASGGPATCAPGWSLDPAANFNDGRDPNNQDGAAGAWRLGDAQRGVLPGDADATLTFPPVDLTSINHAVFTFAHKEALEQGFDGARVEARLDGKGDWIPVVPKGGYPGTLQAANALNDAVPAQRDPGRTVAAFTGDTGPRALGTRGWVNSEFDLGQIPGLTAPVHLLTIDQGHAQPYTALHQAGAGAEDSATTLGTGWCPDSVQKQPYGPLANYDCWQRENLAYDLPKADPAGLDGAGQGHRFWWVGSTQLHTGPVSTFTADLVLQVPPLPGLGFGDRYRLTFWAWRSGLADPVCTQASGDCLAVLGGQATLLAQDPATGWAKYEVVLARPGQSTPPPSTITFSYDDNHARQDTAFGTPDRGAVVDDVQTEVIHLDSGVEKPRGTVGHPTGSPAWDAPAVGRVTARLTVHDGDGRPGSATVSFKVGTIADAAIPTWTLAATLAGSTASFAPATTQTAAVARYRLDFGDGTAAAGLGAPPASLEHTYAAAGNYQPILTVVDTQGVGGTTSAAVAVGTGNPAPTLGLLSLTPDASRQTYTASLALGSGGSPLADYALEFGDGSRETHAVDANNPLPSQSGREYAGHAAPIVWRPVERVPAVADGWNAYAVTGATSAPDGNPQGTAWVFADPGRSSHPADQRDYPVNAAERLLTPFVPLTKVGGTHANLTFWERYDLPKSADTRTVYVQSLDPQLGGGEAPGPWRALHAVSQTNSAYQSTVDRTPDAFCPKASIRNGWCPISLPVDAYIGKRVRFAFEMRTGPLQPALTAPPHPQRNVDAALGFFWMVTEVGIQADTLVGRPVQLRVHAATDASLHEGSLLVDNPRIVGSPYTDNVAVLLDSPGDLRGQPGAVLHLNGTVRNLAPHAAKEPVALQIRVVAANPLDALPPVGVSLVAAPHAMQAETILTGGVKSASVPLGVGQVDRVRFLADLQLPRKDECSKCLYRVEVRLLGAGSSYTDENLGDHQRDMLLAVEANTELTVAGGAIDPPTAELRPGGSEPLTISARLDYSKGTIVLKGLTAHVTASLYDDNGAQVGPTLTLPDMQVAGALLPAPGASATVPLGTWRAPQKGFYVFNVTLEKELPDGTRVAGTSQVGLGQALVGGTPLYWTDDLEGDLAARGWTADSAPATLSPIGSNCANPSIGSVPPGAQSAWHPTTWTAFDGAQSAFVGIDPPDAQSYYASRDEALTTPDITRLLMLKGLPHSSLFMPDLTFRYRSLLGRGANDGLIVMGATQQDGVLGTGTVLPGNYNGAVRCTSGNGNPLLAASIQPAPESVEGTLLRPAFQDPSGSREAQGEWRIGSVRAGALAGHEARGTFRFGTDPQGALRGMAIDSVSLSAYRAAILPARDDVALRTGANKTFLFRIENTGAARDNFTIAIDPVASDCAFLGGVVERCAVRNGHGDVVNPDPVIPVAIPLRVVHLEAGQSTLVAVRATVPDSRFLPSLDQAALVLQMASATDPNQVATSLVQVNHLQRTLLPQLKTTLGRPLGQAGPAKEGAAVPLTITVANQGDAAAAPTGLLLFACPAVEVAGQPVDRAGDVRECLRAWRRGETGAGAPILLPAPTLPCLLKENDKPKTVPQGCIPSPFAAQVNWQPPAGRTGLFHLVALADPASLVHQYAADPTQDGQDELDLRILPNQVPDLAVVDFRVRDAKGAEIDDDSEVFAGDVLTISGSVVNKGSAPAQDVEVFVSAQFPLRQVHVDTLLPLSQGGAPIDVSLPWTASAGTVVVAIKARTSTSLDDPANNQRFRTVAVGQGDLVALLDPPELTLAPGASSAVTLHLANHRTDALAVHAVVQPTPDVAVAGLAGELALEPSGLDDRVFTVTVSPFARPGLQTVRVALLPASGPPLAAVDLVVAVASAQRLAIAADPVIMAPGQAEAQVRIVNQASDTAFTLAATPPPGWNATFALAHLALAAQQAATVSVRLEVPLDAAPGSYEVPLQTAGAPAALLHVQVTGQPRWRSQVEQVRALDGGTVRLVRVTNLGNVPGTPPLDVDGGSRVEPTPGLVDPGQGVVYQITTPQSVALPELPGAAAPPPVAAAGLQVVRWQLLPAANVQAGDTITAQATLRNAGTSVLADVPVRAYVAGQLVAATRTVLLPGQTATVPIAWQASEGDQVVVLSAGAPGEDLAQSELLHVGPPQNSAPAAGLLELLVLLGVAAAARRRRP